jgi:hypothetical protein
MNPVAWLANSAQLVSTVPTRAEFAGHSRGHADRHHFFQATSAAHASPAQPATTVTASE